MAPTLDKIMETHLWEYRRQRLGIREDLIPDHQSEPAFQVVAARLISKSLIYMERRHLSAVCRSAQKVCETLYSIHGETLRPCVLKQRWHRYVDNHLKHIKSEWLAALPEVDTFQAAHLRRNLCLTTAAERVVDFSAAGAQSGYIAQRLRMRSMYLASIFLLPEVTNLRLQLFAHGTVRIVNVGGGPGFEAVGLQLLADFFGEPVNFIHEVIDIEGSWADAVDMLNGVLQRNATAAKTTMSFSTKDLRRLDNPLCEDSEHVHLFIFQYVLVENADILRSTRFAQLRVLFKAAPIGSIFAFLDSSDRLWPCILEAAQESGAYEATFVCVNGKVRMLINHVAVASGSSIVRGASLLEVCYAHAAAHEEQAARRTNRVCSAWKPSCLECLVRRPDLSRFCSEKCTTLFRQGGYCDYCGPHAQIAIRDPENGFCSHACRQKSKALWSVPRAFRPSCTKFAATGACPVGDRCYQRHCVAAQSLPHDLILLCANSHTKRVAEYLLSGELSGGLMLKVIGEERPDVDSENAKGQSTNRLLFVRVLVEGPVRKDACARAHAILSGDANISNVVTRIYAVSCAVARSADVLQSVADDLVALGEPLLRLRVMAFPLRLQQQLAKDVSADSRFTLCPARGAIATLCAVSFADRTEVGIFLCAEAACAVGAAPMLPCRAALKLQEVQRRCANVWPARKQWVAADVGASPGGWTSVLVDSGAGHVFAIDPGALSPVVLARAGVEHVAMRVEEYAPTLLSRGILLDAIVCDMNCSPRMSIDAVLGLLPAARAGATLVITLKKFGRKCDMASDVQDAVGRLRELLSTLRVLQLFSGGADEHTVVGKLVDEKYGT